MRNQRKDVENLLNLGCGSHYHLDWINIKLTSTSGDVIAYDLAKGIPFLDNSVDVVYHSHLLEHFSKNKAKFFIKECHRVLVKGGIIRVVVPDLEKILQNYFIVLQEARDGRTGAFNRYSWTLLELFDQMVRDKPGGEMKNLLERATTAEREFIRDRIGKEAEDYWEALQKPKITRSWWSRLRSKNLKEIVQLIRHHLTRAAILLLAGREGRDIYGIGHFRKSGEIHYWMYDRYSLGELLRTAGFTEVKVCSAFDSRIPGFAGYELDVVNGTIRKPDSLFMEGLRS